MRGGGGGGGSTIPYPGIITKTDNSPGDRTVHDPLRGRQACPKLNSFHGLCSIRSTLHPGTYLGLPSIRLPT